MGPLRNYLPNFSNGIYYKQQRYLWAYVKELGDRKQNHPLFYTWTGRHMRYVLKNICVVSSVLHPSWTSTRPCVSYFICLFFLIIFQFLYFLFLVYFLFPLYFLFCFFSLVYFLISFSFLLFHPSIYLFVFCSFISIPVSQNSCLSHTCFLFHGP
jgi:hypothetical protein